MKYVFIITLYATIPAFAQTKSGNGGGQILLKDPSGNLVELFEAKP